ncbi:GntR family transcriptional regulator [Clostridia bacterium]|nr:GntR family transcriptional regulator [Clostridia bacterium]
MTANIHCLTKGEYVYRVLKDRIFSGEMVKDKTYTVVEIAEELKVSRTPVSEAVKILTSQGYLMMLPAVGFRVKELTFEEINEILLISSALERLALQQIIQKGTEVDTEALNKNLDDCISAIKNKDVDEYARLSDEFHNHIYGAADLPKLLDVMESISIHEAYYQESVLRNPESLITLIEDHKLLLKIVEQKRIDDVDGFLERHVCNCLKTHEIYLK